MATAKKSAGKKSGAAKRSGAAKKGGAAKRGGAAKKSGGSSRGSSAKKGSAKKAGAKRTPNAAFMKPMQPSEQLGQVVGTSPMPRTEITKKLWQYIKKNNLQDAKERRQINADDRLRPIFKRDQVSMFEMTKLVNKHLKDS